MVSMNTSNDVDAYIAKFPADVQAILNRLRGMVATAAPNAEESMSYGMPGYKLNGKPLVYYAGYARHIGLYATPAGHEAFAEELANYKQGKGSVQFPLNAEMPWDLIERIIAFRVKDVTAS